MSKSSKNTQPVTQEMLDKFEIGQSIARYAFYTNLTYQGVDPKTGNIIIHDINGDSKNYPKWMFLKYAEVAK